MSRGAKKVGRLSADAIRRITGLSTPLFGLQWADPGPTERDRVRHFMVSLEDRRALYNPMQLEVRGDVEHSLHKLRQNCTDGLKSLSEDAFAVPAIRAIREACRRFHDDAQTEFRLFRHGDGGPESDAGFFMALGALRATVGYHVAILAAHYGFDVESDLASILPQMPENS